MEKTIGRKKDKSDIILIEKSSKKSSKKLIKNQVKTINIVEYDN